MAFSKNHLKATQKTWSTRLVRLGLGVTVGIMALTFLVAAFPRTASAATGQKTDPLVTYCQTLFKKAEIEKTCVQEDNLTHARNVASYHCDADAAAEKKAACVESKAKDYFKNAANSNPKPKTSADFTKALNKTLNKAGGNPNKPEDGFGTAVTTASGTGGDKSKVKDCLPSDGLCANCSSSNPKDDCVTCDKDNCADSALTCAKSNCDLIKKYVNPAVNLLSITFGLIATASLIYGAITFASSEGDPQKTSKAKDRIAKTIFAVIAYMFLYGFLQFIIPGGAFNR